MEMLLKEKGFTKSATVPSGEAGGEAKAEL